MAALLPASVAFARQMCANTAQDAGNLLHNFRDFSKQTPVGVAGRRELLEGSRETKAALPAKSGPNHRHSGVRMGQRAPRGPCTPGARHTSAGDTGAAAHIWVCNINDTAAHTISRAACEGACEGGTLSSSLHCASSAERMEAARSVALDFSAAQYGMPRPRDLTPQRQDSHGAASSQPNTRMRMGEVVYTRAVAGGDAATGTSWLKWRAHWVRCRCAESHRKALRRRSQCAECGLERA